MTSEIFISVLLLNKLLPALPLLVLPSGASKQLGVIIEGESLLNDGAAIVLFNVFKDELIPNHGRNGNVC